MSEDAAERARALIELGRPDEAERVAAEVLATDPNNQAALLAVVTARQQRNDVEGMVEACRRLVGACPELYLGHALLSLGLGQLQRWDEALPAAQRAVALAPDDPVAASALAGAFTGLPGRDAEAVRAAERVTELAPNDNFAWVMLTGAYTAANRWADAVEAAERAVALDPVSAHGRFMLGNAYLRAGRHDDAVERFRAVLVDEPSEQMLTRLVANLLETGVPERTRDLYQQARTALRQPDVTDPEVRLTDPAQVTLRLSYGRGRLADDDVTAARMADAVLRDVPDHPRARGLAASVAEHRMELVEAIRLAEGLLDGGRLADGLTGDDGWRVHHVRTHSYQRLGRHDEALAALVEAIAAYPAMDEFPRRRDAILAERDQQHTG